jgi:hypothetical protein
MIKPQHRQEIGGMASPQIGCNDAELIAVVPMRRDKYGCRPCQKRSNIDPMLLWIAIIPGD